MTEFHMNEKGQLVQVPEIPQNGKKYEIVIMDDLTGHKRSFRVKNKNGTLRYKAKVGKDYDCVAEKDLVKYMGRETVPVLSLKDQKSLEEADVHFLGSLCEDFKSLKELIDRHMVEEYVTNPITGFTSKMWVPKIPNNDRYRVIKGCMQSRKTWAIITMSLYYLMKYKITTFIVVQNSIDASDQIMSRLRNTFLEYTTYIEDQELKEKFDQLFVLLDVTRGKTASEEQIAKALSGKTPKVYILLRNATDIDPVNEKLQAVREQYGNPKRQRYVTIIDESDFNDSGTVSPIQKRIDTLKKFSTVVYDVTATPMTSLMKEKYIDAGNVIVLTTPMSYKGLRGMDCRSLQEPAVYCGKSEDDPFILDPNLKGYIDDFSVTKPCKCCTFWGEQLVPRYSLVRIGAAIEPQLKAAKYVRENHYEKIVVITYNGGGHGVTLSGASLPTKSILLNNNMRSLVEKDEETDHIIHTFGKGVHIGRIIARLQKDGVKKHPRIMVFAGKMADRGITFGTSEYGECVRKKIYPWHLTEMYFVAAVGMNQANLLQAVGRLCGVHPGNIPQTIYTNSGEDIYKALGVQEELIGRAKLARQKLEEENARVLPVRELIKDQPISREKCCNRRLTSIGVPCPLYKVEDDFVAGGWDWDTEGMNYECEEASFGTGKRTKKIRVQPTEEEKEEFRKDMEAKRTERIQELMETNLTEIERNRLLGRFKVWVRGDEKIARFVGSLDPDRVYREKEIREEADTFGVRLTDCYEGHAENRVGYGNILLKIGNKFRLQPGLVKGFKKYFDYQR